MGAERFQTGAMVAGVERWVACESPTFAVANVNAMLDIVEGEGAAAALSGKRIPGRDGLGDMLLVEAGPANGQPATLLVSHVDTVHPLGTIERDLPMRVEGDRLYGPGAYDMKAGAYLCWQAFLAVARSGGSRRPLRYLFTPDEEIGSPISRQVIEEQARSAAAVLVTEPARDGGRVVTARKGVGRFDMTIEGRPSHSGSKHELGRSAIKEAARQILDIEGMTDYAAGVTTTVGVIKGGSAANVVPRVCTFSIDLRVPTIAAGEAYARRILSLAPHDPDVRLTVTGAINRPPMERSPHVAWLYEQARRAAASMGVDLGEVPMTGGGSDGNFTAAMGVPTLDGLGCEGDGAHTLQEHALISSLAPRAEMVARLLESL